MIIKEWKCLDCEALFESSDAEPSCPNCTAEEAERVFLTAPAIRSPNTSRADTIVKELASDYGLSNVSNRYGEAVKKAPSGPAAPKFEQAGAPTLQVLNKIPAGARDGFSSLRVNLRNPNAALPGNFPHQNRQRLFK